MANVPDTRGGAHVNKDVYPNPPPPQPVNKAPKPPVAQSKKPKAGVTHILLLNGWIPIDDNSLNFTNDQESLNAPWLQLRDDELAFVAMSEKKMLVGRASAIFATKTRIVE